MIEILPYASSLTWKSLPVESYWKHGLILDPETGNPHPQDPDADYQNYPDLCPFPNPYRQAVNGSFKPMGTVEVEHMVGFESLVCSPEYQAKESAAFCGLELPSIFQMDRVQIYRVRLPVISLNLRAALVAYYPIRLDDHDSIIYGHVEMSLGLWEVKPPLKQQHLMVAKMYTAVTQSLRALLHHYLGLCSFPPPPACDVVGCPEFATEKWWDGWDWCVRLRCNKHNNNNLNHLGYPFDHKPIRLTQIHKFLQPKQTQLSFGKDIFSC